MICDHFVPRLSEGQFILSARPAGSRRAGMTRCLFLNSLYFESQQPLLSSCSNDLERVRYALGSVGAEALEINPYGS